MPNNNENKWRPLMDRLKELPLILCGPILRRVERNSVSVFVAIKEKKTVKLELFDTQLNKIGETSTENDSNFLLRIGLNLFVTTITLKLTGTAELKANTYYQYNLSFDDFPMIEPNTGILTDGYLINYAGLYNLPLGLAYKGFTLPSFRLPANEIKNLRFVHGSCRKPHGGVGDVLKGLDDLIEESTSSTNPSVRKKRPQFACFTGDQIYADDVADVLLFMLRDTCKTLIGIDEQLPGLTTNEKNNLETILNPGNRLKLIVPTPNQANEGRFSSAEGKSHLIKLGEFYAMYLFVWSDVLWGNYTTPIIKDILENHLGEMYEDVETLRIMGYDLSHDVVANAQSIRQVYKTLKQVRRALANTPSYMMFDDHEITDDWFLTYKWTDYSLNKENTLSRRIIHNGLSAFAVFQAWGNNPDMFIKDNPKDILEKLQIDKEKKISFYYEKKNIEGIGLLPKLDEDNKKLKEGLDWDFEILFPNFRLLVLDTRTKREYKQKVSPPSLIAQDDLSRQVPDSNKEKELTIVVSPTPIIGYKMVEHYVQTVFARFLKEKEANLFVDKEAWVFDKEIMEKLLARLSKYKRVVILSGDVHYAFSASIQYWDNRINDSYNAAFIQLCSSSLKNSEFNTHITSSEKFIPNSFFTIGVNFNDGEKKCIEIGHRLVTINRLMGKEKRNIYVSNSNPSFDVYEDYEFKLSIKPDWEYSVEFNTYLDKQSDIVLPNIANNSTNKYQSTSKKHRESERYDKQRTVVGHSNFGVVHFNWSDANPEVHHELYYDKNDFLNRLSQDYEIDPKPTTIHKLSLKEPDENTPKPSERT